MKGMGGDAARDKFFKTILKLFQVSKIPFMVGGGYAFAMYTSIRRDTKDLDLFIKPEDAPRALTLGSEAGYKTWIKSPHWLGKIAHGEWFVDLIYSSGNGACPVDDAWFEHGPSSTLLGAKVKLTPPEEMIWSKAFIMERHRYDGADVAHILRAKARELDWDRLIERFGDRWLVLLSHLMMFRFIYPKHAADVPDAVIAQLLERLPGTTRSSAADRLSERCNGTLLSFHEYLPDVRSWGLLDARLKSLGGSMSQVEIDRWTAERK